MPEQAIALSPDSPWFVPLFFAMWLGVTGLLAQVSGWASLSSQFRATGSIEGKRFRFSSGSMGRRFFPVNYGNCLFITVGPQGLHLSILFLFRFLSPPLFIPWTSIGHVEKRHFLFFPYYILTIRDHWARLGLYGWTGRHVKDAFDAANDDSDPTRHAIRRV